MTNICFFIHNLSSHGGTERISISLANALAKLPDYQVSMLSLEVFDSTFFPLNEAVKTASLNMDNTDIRKTYLKAVKRLRRFLKENEVDVVIDIDVILSAISLPATVFTKTKVVSWEAYNYYTNTESIVRRIARILAARYSKIIVTQTNQDIQFYKDNCKVKSSLVSILNPIENLPSGFSCSLQKIILSIGHLEHRKGFDLLLEVWRKIDPKVKDGWKIRIIGEGKEKEKLEEQIEEDKTGDSVEILPPSNHIEEYYKKAAIYSMTSRAEGLPMVLIEAKSYGIPAIAFDCRTGPGEIINHGIDGFLIPCYDTELYAEKLSQLMQDSQLREQMNQKALADRDRFSLAAIIQKWVELLNSVK
jgi:glycosyltransferase involved in cell wall biosynthesis